MYLTVTITAVVHFIKLIHSNFKPRHQQTQAGHDRVEPYVLKAVNFGSCRLHNCGSIWSYPAWVYECLGSNLSSGHILIRVKSVWSSTRFIIYKDPTIMYVLFLLFFLVLFNPSMTNLQQIWRLYHLFCNVNFILNNRCFAFCFWYRPNK